MGIKHSSRILAVAAAFALLLPSTAEARGGHGGGHGGGGGAHFSGGGHGGGGHAHVAGRFGGRFGGHLSLGHAYTWGRGSGAMRYPGTGTYRHGMGPRWGRGFWVWGGNAWSWNTGAWWASPAYPGWVWVVPPPVWDGTEWETPEGYWTTADQLPEQEQPLQQPPTGYGAPPASPGVPGTFQ